MRKETWKAGLVCVTLALVLNAHAKTAAGQTPVDIVTEGGPIPKHFQSWSLFLICNPQWFLAESNSRLSELYRQFRSFGHAIGARHAAIWFWKRRPGPGGFTAEDVDVDRNAAYCEKLRLLPSRSPYVLVTTSYPDLNADDLKREVLIELNSLPPADVGQLLTRLADQLLVQGLRQAEFDSEQYWAAWRRTLESARDVLKSAARKVKITINTAVVKLEIDGGAD
ncbi:MAG TPA: hypothetical protein VNO43_09170 [Candidatus Eisenbacteria bacterium]|nr:hypothetical protein [Candidatus Eisenbacteria bacterium]